MYSIKNSVFFLFLTLCFIGKVTAESDENPEIGIVEKLDAYLPGDILMVSENGDTVLTKDIFLKPTVLSLVYYRCPGICTPLMDGLADVINRTSLTLGADYQVITLSFNPNEGTLLAKRKKTNYMNVLNMEVAAKGWMFYTSDSLNIVRMTESVGFFFKKTGSDYQHAGTLIFLSHEGKITRYLNGTRFLPFEFKMAIIEAAEGKSGPAINKVLQYCYSFDPEGDGYVLNITRVSGVIITFILLLFFSVLVIKSFRKSMNRNHKINTKIWT